MVTLRMSTQWKIFLAIFIVLGAMCVLQEDSLRRTNEINTTILPMMHLHQQANMLSFALQYNRKLTLHNLHTY